MPMTSLPSPVSPVPPSDDVGRALWIRGFIENLLALSAHMPEPPRMVVRYRKGKVPPEAAAPNGTAGAILDVRDAGPHTSHVDCSIILVQVADGRKIGIPVHRASLERPLALRGGFRDRSREFRFPEVTEAHFGGRQEKGTALTRKPKKGKKS